MTAPNDVWTYRLQSQFKTRDGNYCYPLHGAGWRDPVSPGCQACCIRRIALTRPVLERLSPAITGCPTDPVPDNAPPFAANTLGRLSTLAVWWVRLGIRPS